MTTERKKLGFEKFISRYFSCLGKLTKVNLIFAVPLCVAFGLCFLICKTLLPQATMIILPLTIVLASPFYSGVVVVGKKIYFDELNTGIFQEYLKAVKENFKGFIVHGVVAYVAVVGCYHGIVIYNMLAQSNWIFYVMLVVSALVALFLLFLLFGAPLMSAFFDLKLKDVYKNSFLMTFGELKANFFTAVGIIVYLLVVTMPLMFFFTLTSVWGELTSLIVIYAYVGLICVALVPSGVSSIITATLYPDMKRVITGEARAMQNSENKDSENKEAQSDKSVSDYESDADDFSGFDIKELEKSSGDYVFYNGKMIKKSIILEKLKDREEM